MKLANAPNGRSLIAALDQSAIVAATDGAGRIIYCNARFIEVSGYAEVELLGRNHNILNSGTHPKTFFQEMYRTITSGETWRGTVCNRRKDGELYWVDTTIVPEREGDGPITGYIAIRTEVTGHVAALQALKRAKEAALRAGSAKDQFLANMSHEVRTPLSGIVGLAEVLARTPLTAEQRGMVDLIMDSSHSLRRIVDDVLDLAKAEAGELSIESQPFDLREEVVSAAELHRVRAVEKGLAFDIAFSDEASGWISADPLRMRQVLANLISNAIKFTQVGSVQVRVTLDETDAGLVLAIEVEDTGIGFDEDTAARLFDRFAQADESTARKFGGTGLGLPIARNLAQLMGGDVTTRSRPGEGSCFRLTIPVTRAAPPGALTRPVPGSDDVAAAGVRVLVAEDHPVNQLVVKGLLDPLGVELTIVPDGAEAVREAAIGAYDAILMDLQMPVMDGIEAIRRIRMRERADRRARTPIAVMTANTSDAHHRAAEEAGADGFIPKPLSLDTLLGGLEDLLAGLSRAAAA